MDAGQPAGRSLVILLGVAAITYGAGAFNLVNAVAGSYAERSPVIVLSVNEPRFFARNYLRFINNQLRKEYGWPGSRIFVKMKKH